MKYQRTFRQILAMGLWAGFFSAICFTSLIPAQSGVVALQGGSPAMNYSRELLKRVDVQKELGLDEQQKEGLTKAIRDSYLPIIVVPIINPQDILKLSDEERKQFSAEVGREGARQVAYVRNERQREVEAILRPDQQKRLTEIDLQWRGVLALSDESLSERLGVSSEHQEYIKAILAKFFSERLPLLDPHEGSERTSSPLYQKRQALLQETEQKVLSLLSNDEKARWARAIGKPFKFEE